VLFNGENGMKMAKPAKDFDIPGTMFTTTLKSNDKTISHVF